MITINLLCRHCESDQIVRNGHTRNGKQKYLCRSCGRQSHDAARENGYSQKRKAEILAAYREGNSLRSVSRIFGVSRNTLSLWIKQAHSPDPTGRPAPALVPADDSLDLAHLFTPGEQAPNPDEPSGGESPPIRLKVKAARRN